MRNNETGEFEMVMGNRQLISGFFIVVILFGIFFAMGYIVGRNSAPSPRMQAETAAPNVPNTNNDTARPQAASGAPAAPLTAAPAPAAEEKAASGEQAPAENLPEPATQPAREPERPKAAASAAQPAQTPVSEPPADSGTYLQVLAVQRPVAEEVSQVLRGRKFPVTLSPGPNGLVRVLVGPYQDKATLGKAKAELENAGFHAFVKK